MLVFLVPALYIPAIIPLGFFTLDRSRRNRRWDLLGAISIQASCRSRDRAERRRHCLSHHVFGYARRGPVSAHRIFSTSRSGTGSLSPATIGLASTFAWLRFGWKITEPLIFLVAFCALFWSQGHHSITLFPILCISPFSLPRYAS